MVWGSVEETLHSPLEAEAQRLTQAARYERSEGQQAHRSGHYQRNVTTTSSDVSLNPPRLNSITFETTIIERYRRRGSAVEKVLLEIYPASVSMRRAKDITEALWGSKVSPSTISEPNKKGYVHIQGRQLSVCLLRCNRGRGYENMAILVAFAVNVDGYRKVLDAAEGMKKDKAKAVVAKPRAMKLKEADKKAEDGSEETLTYADFPSEHWTRIRTKNVIEPINRDIRHRTCIVGASPDGHSALILVCARLHHAWPVPREETRNT